MKEVACSGDVPEARHLGSVPLQGALYLYMGHLDDNFASTNMDIVIAMKFVNHASWHVHDGQALGRVPLVMRTLLCYLVAGGCPED